jgi:hypothetical protein
MLRRITSPQSSSANDTTEAQAPSVPTNLSCTGKTTTTTYLIKTGSTDIVGVKGGKIYRNENK